MIDTVLLGLLALVGGSLLWMRRGRLRTRLTPVPAGGGPSQPGYYRKLSRQAGFSPDGAWPVYLGAKIALALVLPLLVAEVWGFVWWAVLPSAAIGVVLPDAVLASLRRARQQTMRRALSFFLDLLASLLQAGLNLEEAFTRAARSGLPPGHPLAKEAEQLVHELGLGRERGRGFQALAERTGLVELLGLASALQLGSSLGASLGTTLKAEADLLRAKRREEGLKRLNMMSAEVLLPIMLCTFPVFVVLVVVPLGIIVFDSLSTFRSLLR